MRYLFEKSFSDYRRKNIIFSVKHQSVYARMKALGIMRKKRHFFMKKEAMKKRREFNEIIKDEKEDDIVYIDESGTKSTLRNGYA